MQNIVELKTEETNAVVGGLMVKREGPLQQIERAVLEVIRTLEQKPIAAKA